MFKQNIPRQKHTSDESFRVYRFIHQEHTVKGKKFKGHYINRAYTVDGQFYECITLNAPSIALLEYSVRKWAVKGKVTSVDTELSKLTEQGWKLMPRAKIGTKTERRKAEFDLEKDPWVPTDKDFDLAIEREEARNKFFENNQDLHIVKEVSTWYTQDPELQRALDFQKRQLEKTKKRKK